MNIYTLLMIIPVVLAVALIIMIVRRNITENSGRSIDIAPAIPAVVVLMIAILVIAPMAESTQDYIFDEHSGKLTINKDIPQLAVQPWDEYADEVKSLVIKDGVTIGSGVFDSLTSLEYVSIGEDVTLGSNVFGMTMKDFRDRTMASPSEGEYVALDGILYHADEGIYTYSSSGWVSGLTSEAASAVNLVLPKKNGDTTVTSIYNDAFRSNATIKRVLVLPGDYSYVDIGSNVFYQATALETVQIPEGVQTLGYRAFADSSLVSISLPGSLRTLGGQAFSGASNLVAIDFPEGLTTIPASCLQNSGIQTASFPASISSIGSWAFNGCSSITQVSFAAGFAPSDLNSEAFRSWTFYASDGTTVIDKTVASNLAGKTFQGTAAALVEVAPGQLALTPQQIEQVNLHTMEDQDLDIQPMPFQPAVQTQDQEQETA